ncbi:MAG: hypothetical protein HY925_02200 [Elusimicrobia bacterium]|nr:hypothetical protein [Elusimicrobiota bacterium]
MRLEPRLRLACAALLLYYCHTFGVWHADHAATLSTYGLETANVLPTRLVAALGGPWLLPPFWTLLHLAGLYFLGLFGLLSLFRKNDRAALWTLGFLFANKAYYYACDLRLHSDAHHLHLLLSFLFLVARERLFFLRAGLVASFWALARAKLGPSWAGGDYFLARPDFPAWAAPYCALWVGIEALAPLLWLSELRLARAAALAVLAAAYALRSESALLLPPLLLCAFWDDVGPMQRGFRPSAAQWQAWAALALFLLAGVPPSEDDRAGAARITVASPAGERTFDVVWPWRAPTRRPDGTVSPAASPYYRGDWTEIVREGDKIVFNPYAFISLPNRLLGPWPFELYARRLCREGLAERVDVALELRRDGRMSGERVELSKRCALP